MASIQFDQNGDYSDNMLHVDMFGEPEILPRIGDGYQAELPQFLGDSNSLFRSSRHSTDDETRADFKQSFILGLPINLMWISSELNLLHDLRKSLEESENVPALDKIHDCSGPDSRLVPGVCGEQWTAAEKDCFLLGLYIFAKNFVVVRRFVGTKEMGAVQSYYYGRFCSSPEHRRWSNIRRRKNKRGKFGRGMFSGLRLQELLSRLLPTVGECQNALLEVFKSFENKEISLADYVFSLKAMVGADILLEAVGIGRGHQDHNVVTLGHSKSNLVTKMFSSLTTTEIFKLLSGQHRWLSKARLSGLFWEAVWPRLLVNGWHLEQPKSYRHIADSSPIQVFLMPGIKKFSRRKLVLGDHYFDTIIDVMSKVAREPCWLELNHKEVDCSNGAEQCEWTAEGESKENGENHRRFTVVETCLSNGNVIELRTLPDDTQEANTDESNSINTIMVDASEADGSPKTHDQPSQESLSLDMLPSTSSLGHSLQDRIEQPLATSLIDLNFPPDSKNGSFAAESSHEQDITSNKPDDNGLQETDMQGGTGEQSSNSNPRRYSTRHRPPTTRVLDCFAHGYLTASRRQKRKEASPHEDHALRASQLARGESTSTANEGSISGQ